jgi:hypothetical protein
VMARAAAAAFTGAGAESTLNPCLFKSEIICIIVNPFQNS